ncbi:hypothetical protein B0H21DRAFT_692903 [Amylocystis lapponica]|nr:hypothetical protein B0H21DRAFT_692903 [Amylocystis lapponica]
MSQWPLPTSPPPHSATHSATHSAATQAGYEALKNLFTSTPESPANDLNTPLASSQALFSATQTPRAVIPMTQSAASMVGATKTFSTQCGPLDRLLGGGLRRGHILELSGPPGCAKEALAISIVRTFLQSVQEVVFVADMQNMTSPAVLSRALQKPPSVPTDSGKRIHHLALHTLADLMVFIRNLEAYLQEHPNTSLLVLNSLSFPFQSTSSLPIPTRGALLDIVKQTLARVCASRNLTVVITSQLATKMLNRDGTAATYNTSSRAVMAPQLGYGYLPSGRTYRVIVVRARGRPGQFVLRLATSPTSPVHVQGRQHVREERYETVRGLPYRAAPSAMALILPFFQDGGHAVLIRTFYVLRCTSRRPQYRNVSCGQFSEGWLFRCGTRATPSRTGSESLVYDSVRPYYYVHLPVMQHGRNLSILEYLLA